MDIGTNHTGDFIRCDNLSTFFLFMYFFYAELLIIIICLFSLDYLFSRFLKQ